MENFRVSSATYIEQDCKNEKLMDNLQDKLLEHVVPDQVGQVGKVHYRFTEMRIVHVHWPKVTNTGKLFIANNGALRLHGHYNIQRPGVLGYNKTGEFVFDLGAICLTIKDNTTDSQPSPQHSRHNNHHRHTHHHRHRPLPHDVTCTVGLIKVKFQGGAARLCQFLTSLYIKVYRRHLEAQIAKVIQEAVQDDGQILLSALTVMASMHSESDDTIEDQRAYSENHTRNTPIHSSASSSTEVQEVGKMQRFLDSFTRHRPET